MQKQHRYARPILLSDGHTRTALATVRALAKTKHAVHVLQHEEPGLAASSRFAAATHRVPNPEHNPAAWALAIQNIAAGLPNSLLLPVTDASANAVFQTQLHQRLEVALPDSEAFEQASDKYLFATQAAESGLLLPKTQLLEDLAAVRTLPDGFQYPVIVKARRSRFWYEDHWCFGGVHRVENEAEFGRLADEPGLKQGALLQEWLPGSGAGGFFLVERGKVLAEFAHRRLREKPPGGGVSVLCEAISLDSQLRAACHRYLARLNWHGVAMIEFREHPDGRLFAMELNPRLWGSLQLAIDAGVDFPSRLVNLFSDLPSPIFSGYREGARLRWLFGDMDHLLILLRRPALRRQLGVTSWQALTRFCRSFVDGTRSEICRGTDRGPFWCELKDRLGVGGKLG